MREGRIHVGPLEGAPSEDFIGLELTSDAAHGKLLFYGQPQGYEITLLVMALADLGEVLPDPPLVSPETQAALGALSKDVHIQVFSTPG